jgi:hypothetical protein
MLAHPSRLSSAVALIVLILPSGAFGQEREAPPPPEKAGSPEDTLRPEEMAPFPAAYEGRRIADRLLRIAAEKGGAEAAEMRLLAATALDAAGEIAAARELRKTVIHEGPEPTHRARAAFALGLRNFLEERYNVADAYWKVLPQIDPDSPWTARAARFRPYLQMVRDRVLPDFEAEFATPAGEKVRRSRKDLAGRFTLIHFWSTPADIDEVNGWVADTDRIASRVGKLPEAVPFEVLGINLDASGERCEEARRASKMPWPVLHDGLGYGNPLVRAFGIPRTPHWVLVGPDGKVSYAGGRLTRKKSVEEALFPPKRKAEEKAEKAE